MASKAEVKANANWFTNEKKQLMFVVRTKAGVPVDLTGKTLVYALMKKPGSDHLVTKSTDDPEQIFLETEDDVPCVAVVNIDATDTVEVKAGVALYHELKDTGNDDVLAFGPVTFNASGIA